MAIGTSFGALWRNEPVWKRPFSFLRWESPRACSCVHPSRCRNPARLWMYGITCQDPQCSRSPSPAMVPFSSPSNTRSTRSKHWSFSKQFTVPTHSPPRRRDRWGVYYDSESSGIYVETFLVDSWVEHQRQHGRFTIADRTVEIEQNCGRLPIPGH